MASVKTAGQKGGCHRPDCQGFDGKKYRFHGTQWIRKSVVENPVGDENTEADDPPILTQGAIIEEGVCPHEKAAFGDLLEPLESDHDSADQERQESMNLDQYTHDQLDELCDHLDLSGYSDMLKNQKVDYVAANAGPSFDPSEVLESNSDSGDEG